MTMATSYKKGASASIQYVKGVGPKLAILLKKKGIVTVEDALYFLPRTYEDRSKLRTISELEPMEYGLFEAEVLDFEVNRFKGGRKQILTVKVGDGTGKIVCKWFNFSDRYFSDFLKKGAKVFVSGTTSIYNGRMEMHHPDIEPVGRATEDKLHYGRIVPIYSETEGLGQKTIRRIMYNVVENFSNSVEDFMPPAVLSSMKLAPLSESLRQVHFPSKGTDIKSLCDFRNANQKRLIFDEFFVLELAFSIRRRGIKKRPGISFDAKPDWLNMINSKLPFKLTDAQTKVIEEILIDMKSSEPMNRLIQGDVGSGKTIVAFYAAAIAILNGKQVAMMAPTEILAEQHYKNFVKLFGENFKAELLVSSINKIEKQNIKTKIENGEVGFVVGTHALIQEDVNFKDLGLIVVDEQHRFGVEQRLNLIKKGTPDTIVMTATPIPRTLAMTLYGDLDVSVIDEKPSGRQPITTRVVTEDKRKVVYDFVRSEIQKGRQAYFIYPLIEESEKLMLKNVKDAVRHLSAEFKGWNVGLLHGKVRPEEKEAVMRDFKDGKINILVSTTVVEVGIDVPNATVMFIEHPERFGLSQLHQLRGRIGRGEFRSVCILMAGDNPTEASSKRLMAMAATEDGFKIAEQDLELRGPGEFFGTRQHGIPGFRVGNLVRDIDTLVLARNEADRLIKIDPELVMASNRKLRFVLTERFRDKIRLMDS